VQLAELPSEVKERCLDSEVMPGDRAIDVHSRENAPDQIPLANISCERHVAVVIAWCKHDLRMNTWVCLLKAREEFSKELLGRFVFLRFPGVRDIAGNGYQARRWSDAMTPDCSDDGVNPLKNRIIGVFNVKIAELKN